eukprot:s82_g38.t1
MLRHRPSAACFGLREWRRQSRPGAEGTKGLPGTEMPSPAPACPSLARLFRCGAGQEDLAVTEVANAIYQGGKADGLQGLECVACIIQNRCGQEAFPNEPQSVVRSGPFHRRGHERLQAKNMEASYNAPGAGAPPQDGGGGSSSSSAERPKRKSEPVRAGLPETRLQESWEYPLSREEKKHRVMCLFEQELAEARRSGEELVLEERLL